jgi:hypothetical protein
MAQELISPTARAERLKIKKAVKASIDSESEKLFALKTNVWNKIITSNDFENFNDRTYFRWLEIYKDKVNVLWTVNPISIEQKMAFIEVINSRLIPKILGPESNLSVDVQKLSTYKLRKLQMHMRAFNLNSKLTRENLNNFAADLFIILKGPPISLLDYFTKNKSARMNERLMRALQEDMLVMGLKGMINRIPEKDSYNRIEKSKYFVQKFFQHKLWKFLVIPYDLPWIDRVKIPEELLQRIMIDGLEAHDQELITHLKNQGMIDHYERFRKVYKPIAFSIGFYFYYEKFSDKLSGELNTNQEKERARLIEDFETLGASIIAISDVPLKAEEQMKEEQFQRLIEAYKKTHQEDPSPEEYEDFHVRVFGTPN